MKSLKRTMVWRVLLPLVALTPASGQEPTVYATVISTKLFVVGAANPQTGLFYQHPNEASEWHHTGAKNIRGNGVAVVPGLNGRVIYIASGNGLHKTTDGGASWKIMTGWEITELLSVCPDPRNAENVFIGTAYGIYKSVNGGATWKKVHTGFTSCVIIDRFNSAILYASTENGLVRSSDGGATWARTGLSIQRIRTVAQHPRQSETLMAGTEDNGLYLSTDAGKTWTKLEAGLDHPTFYTVAFDPSNPDTVYAGGYATGVYKSTDGGATWKRSCKGFKVDHIHSIGVDPTNPSRLYAATIGDGVYRSDDAGLSWANVGLTGSQVWAIAIDQP